MFTVLLGVLYSLIYYTLFLVSWKVASPDWPYVVLGRCWCLRAWSGPTLSLCSRPLSPEQNTLRQTRRPWWSPALALALCEWSGAVSGLNVGVGGVDCRVTAPAHRVGVLSGDRDLRIRATWTRNTVVIDSREWVVVRNNAQHSDDWGSAQWKDLFVYSVKGVIYTFSNNGLIIMKQWGKWSSESLTKSSNYTCFDLGFSSHSCGPTFSYGIIASMMTQTTTSLWETPLNSVSKAGFPNFLFMGPKSILILFLNVTR